MIAEKYDALWSPTHSIIAMLVALAATTTCGEDRLTDAANRSNVQASTVDNLRYTVTAVASAIKLGGKLSLLAELHNSGREPVTVYWGEYAYPKMYRFHITHESGRRLATTRGALDDWLPRSARERYLVTIEPGKSVKYQIVLAPLIGTDGQVAYFRRPGKYRIAPSLFISTTEILDLESGETRPTGLGSWTGRLTSAPFTITVEGDADIVNEDMRIVGRVVNSHGVPVADALVVVSMRIHPGPLDERIGEFSAPIDQTLTDANGQFEFIRLASDSRFFELKTIADGYPVTESKVSNSPSDDEPQLLKAEVKLPEGITLKGRVVDSQGKPCDDVRCRFSDASGQFALAVVKIADHYRMSIGRRGFHEATVEVSRDMATSGKWTITLRRTNE
jgi:hypothetical protein